MADSNLISNITEATFNDQVIAQSQRVPVLVDYWADWCGPCRMQLPVLLKLVEEHDGRLLLAKVNTDEERGRPRAARLSRRSWAHRPNQRCALSSTATSTGRRIARVKPPWRHTAVATRLPPSSNSSGSAGRTHPIPVPRWTSSD